MITKRLQELRAKCQPWQGDLHPYTNQPIDAQGNHINYGYRRCGLLDCVNPDHFTLIQRQGRTATGALPAPLFKTKPTISGPELHKIAKPLLRYTEPNECQVPGCHKPHRATNLCAAHSTQYAKWRKANGLGRIRQDLTQGLPTKLRAPKRYLTVKEAVCQVTQCARQHYARGLCKLHYYRWHRTNQPTRQPV